jgi:hypothetical protein
MGFRFSLQFACFSWHIMRPTTTRKTIMTKTINPKPTIKVEDFGNGIFINWKIHTN